MQLICSPVGLHLPKQVWSRCLTAQKPSCFLSVKWHGEAVYRLGVRGVRVSILLGVIFLPSVALVSQQSFGLTELMLSCFFPLVAILDPSENSYNILLVSVALANVLF
jgi:hypothetical protein